MTVAIRVLSVMLLVPMEGAYSSIRHCYLIPVPVSVPIVQIAVSVRLKELLLNPRKLQRSPGHFTEGMPSRVCSCLPASWGCRVYFAEAIRGGGTVARSGL